MAVAVAVAVSGGVAVPVPVPVAGLTKRFFNQKDFLINVWGYFNVQVIKVVHHQAQRFAKLSKCRSIIVKV